MMEGRLLTQRGDFLVLLLDDRLLVLRPATTKRRNEEKEKKRGQCDHQHDAERRDDRVGQDEIFERLLVDHRRRLVVRWGG